MPYASCLKESGLKPHRLERYLASDDPEFESKAADILGPYLCPPQHAVVFCGDEKTAIQALDRRSNQSCPFRRGEPSVTASSTPAWHAVPVSGAGHQDRPRA